MNIYNNADVFSTLKEMLDEPVLWIIVFIIDLIIIFFMSLKHRTIKRASTAEEYIKSKDIEIITKSFRKFL